MIFRFKRYAKKKKKISYIVLKARERKKTRDEETCRIGGYFPGSTSFNAGKRRLKGSPAV